MDLRSTERFIAMEVDEKLMLTMSVKLEFLI